MTQGKSQRNANGKRVRNSNGKRVKNSATNNKCCCEGGVPCSICPDTTPTTYRTTFSGCTIDFTDCYDLTSCTSAYQSYRSDGAASFTGTFDLTQTANPCVWKYQAAYPTIVGKYWIDPDPDLQDTTCDGDPAYVTNTITITLTRITSPFDGFTLTVIISVGGDIPNGIYMFSSQESQTNCNASFSIPNDSSTTSPCDDNVIARFICNTGIAALTPL